MNTQDKSMFTSNIYGVRIPWTLTPYKPSSTYIIDRGVEYANQQIMNYDGSSFTVRMAVPSPINPFTHLRVESLGSGKCYRILNVKTLAAGVSEFTCVFDPIVYMYTSAVFKGLLISGWQTGTINESDPVLNAVDGLTPIYKTLYKSPELSSMKAPPRLFIKMKGSMRDFNDLSLPMTKYVENDRYSGAAGGSTKFDDYGIHIYHMGGPSNTTTGIIYECITDNLNPTHVMAGLAKDLKHTGKVVDAWIDQPIARDGFEFNSQQMSITLPNGTSSLFKVRSNEPKVLYSFEIMAAGDQLNDKARDNKYIRVTCGMTTLDISYNDIFWLSDKPEGYVTGDNSMYCSIIYIPATSSEGGMLQVVSTKGEHYTTMTQRDETLVYPYSTYYAEYKADLLSGPSRLLASIPLEVVPIGIYGYGWSEYIQRQKFQMADNIISGIATDLIEIFSKGAIQLSEMTYDIDTSATGKDNTRANQGGISSPTHITNDVNMSKILTSRTDIVKNSDGTTTTKAMYSIPKNDNEDGSNTGGERNQSYTASATTSNQSQLERATQTVKSESKSNSILGVSISSKIANGVYKLLKIGIDLAAQFEDALSTPLAGGDSHGVAYFGTVTVSRAVYDYEYLPGTSKYEQDVRKRNLLVILNNPAKTMNNISWWNIDKFKCKSELEGVPIYYIEGKFIVETSSIKNSENYRLSPQELQMLTDMFRDGFSMGY